MAEQLRVLHSLPTVRPTTNPYLVLLRRCLRARSDVELLDFRYARALVARYDVFHVHWPENLLVGANPVKTLVRQLLLTLVLLRITIRRIPIVRTVHNLERPSGLRRREHVLLTWIDRLTRLRIHLNEHTPAESDMPWVLIPHGHYREWFAPFPQPAPVPGRFGYAGLIRRYKGVESLLAAFRSLPGAGPDEPAYTLRIGGRPSTEELAQTLRTSSGDDSRIQLQLTFLSEAEFADVVCSSELVVLPYRLMHNSGGALAGLSLARPVLVPDNEVNRSLAHEVGPGWVHTFEGDLGAEDLVRALQAARAPGRSSAPDLSGRDWSGTAQAHVDAYRQAVAAGHRGRSAQGRIVRTASRSRATDRGHE